MDDNCQIKYLEERIKLLEEKLNKIVFSEAKEVIVTNCAIGDIVIGDNCKLEFQHCPIGSVIDRDIDEAESRLDDIECRLDEINSNIDETESRLDKIGDDLH